MTFSSTKTNTRTIIEVKSLTAAYGSRPIIRDLSLNLNSSSFLAIIGRNGSGKSTLLKSLSGKLPFTGSVFISGQELTSSSKDSSIKKNLTLLYQKNQVTFPIPVRELVVMGLFRRKNFFEPYSSEDYIKVDTVLQNLGLYSFRNKSFQELSGGEQQMVWIGQCLLQDVPVLLLDEPTQQLDPSNKKKVFEILQRECHKGKTVICSTHDLHNLKAIDGYYINMSDDKPELKSISEEAIEEEYRKLES